MDYKGVIRLAGMIDRDKILGTGELADGKIINWTAERKSSFFKKPSEPEKKPEPFTALPLEINYPNVSYGRPKLPEQPEAIFVKGATIWTMGPQGKLENADIIIQKGKILQVGKNLTAPKGAKEIDAKGKHLTPGLIDAHSHTAASGSVNEGTQAITAEVRIGDIIDSDEIAIYRELAGGLTTANVLHGSANPIGGQNQVIKLRWGVSPEEMKFEGAMPGIKFALGENVKQSNWGDRFTTRYPQTRMGVEQIIRDEFRSALDYKKIWDDYNAKKNPKSKIQNLKSQNLIPPRRDLELETIVEILEGKRLVHCHSYRQDELLMILRVAESFGFKIATLQHVLDGYKVADQIAKHGAGASTFSDWWAYKFEVYDATPYNGALMNSVGVIVSFNSDSDEMARRMNTESAKAIKYGGLNEESALKFVTINPAKQLRIDNRVGSIEVGKDADFVIWSENPLSTYTICEETWIDGRKYFDRKEDKEMQEKIVKERAMIIQRILEKKDKK
jgi:imidazolonepropionase-like amidohydrolase